MLAEKLGIVKLSQRSQPRLTEAGIRCLSLSKADSVILSEAAFQETSK